MSSTSTEDQYERSSERDSVMSDATSVRDSSFTLMGGFLNADRNPPNLQQLGARGTEHGGYEVGRVSLKPVIVGSAASSEVGYVEEEEREIEVGQRSKGANGVGYAYGQQETHHDPMERGRGRPREEPPNAAAYIRSGSQPLRSDRRPPPRQHSDAGDNRQPQYPIRRDSEKQAPLMTRQGSLPLRQDSANQYRPYRQDSSSSGATSIGPLSRQGSAENEVFPAPQRQGSSGLIVPLSRQGSAEAEVFPLHRQGSGNSDRLHPHRQDSRGSEHKTYPRSLGGQNSGESGKYKPYRAGPPAPLGLNGDGPGELYERRRPSRQDSNESDRGRHMGRSHEPQFHLGPQRSPTHSPAPMILAMMAGMRTVSPESVSASPVDSVFTLGSPTSCVQEHHPRPSSAASLTPSISPSIYSIGGTPKPMFNFSRPLSNRPSMDTMNATLDIPQRLSPEHSPMFPDEEFDQAPVPAVVYSRFVLPRGRELDRNSILFLGPGQAVTYPQQPASAVRPQSPSSPPSAFLQPVARDRAATYSRSPSASRPQLLSPGPRPHTSASPRSPRSPSHITLPPTTPTSAIMSPEDHVQKGISLHESGSLQESTYHLRLAAKGGHPTGMLLFALACRHGWGMKANPKEGVMWLKKVTELASNEVADDEMSGGQANLFEKKGRRAQFALSIYELGVSHMNGWGTEMDKGLALRCFEIAGSKFPSPLWI